MKYTMSERLAFAIIGGFMYAVVSGVTCLAIAGMLLDMATPYTHGAARYQWLASVIMLIPIPITLYGAIRSYRKTDDAVDADSGPFATFVRAMFKRWY